MKSKTNVGPGPKKKKNIYDAQENFRDAKTDSTLAAMAKKRQAEKKTTLKDRVAGSISPAGLYRRKK